MKEIFFALIVWSGGAVESYDFASERACVRLTRDIALLVESANCYSAIAPAGYLSAPIILSAPVADYIPPAD